MRARLPRGVRLLCARTHGAGELGARVGVLQVGHTRFTHLACVRLAKVLPDATACVDGRGRRRAFGAPCVPMGGLPRLSCSRSRTVGQDEVRVCVERARKQRAAAVFVDHCLDACGVARVAC